MQLGGIFPDGKTFVDRLPKRPLEEIAKEYRLDKTSANFNLRDFVDTHFERPPDTGQITSAIGPKTLKKMQVALDHPDQAT